MIDKYLGIPYKYRGRDFNGVDCYGLWKLYYKETLGITLPEYLGYNEDWYREGRTVLSDKIDEFSKLFKEVDNPNRNDIFIFKLNSRVENHCGVYLGSGKFIHCYEKSPVCVDRLNDYWRTRLVRILRYCNG